jgi:hypothetical protein
MAGQVNNPFSGANDLSNTNTAYPQIPGPFTDLSATPGGPNLQSSLDTLRDAIGTKIQEVQNLGGDGARINQNLVLIKGRVQRIGGVINDLFLKLEQLETQLQNSFDETLKNIAQDVQTIRQGGMNEIIGEIAAINNELTQLQQTTVGHPRGQSYGQNGQLLSPSDPGFNTVPAIDAAGSQIQPAAAQGQGQPGQPGGDPQGFYGGGKKKKGGYTYPKMRSRSRLRSHPRVTHKFNTIKPKKHTRRHRKHKKSSKKHRKH